MKKPLKTHTFLPLDKKKPLSSLKKVLLGRQTPLRKAMIPRLKTTPLTVFGGCGRFFFA